MKKITILLFVFSCTISFSQKLYQDKTTIGIGTYVATNKSITETIQIEQVIIKNAKTSSHIFLLEENLVNIFGSIKVTFR